MVDSAKTVASRLLQRAGCGRRQRHVDYSYDQRQRHADYFHDQLQEQALTGFTSETPSAPMASAPTYSPAASGPGESVIWNERLPSAPTASSDLLDPIDPPAAVQHL